MSYILLDIGANKTRVTVSEDAKTYEEEVVYKTPVSYTDGLKKFEFTLAKLSSSTTTAVVAGVRGQLDDAKSYLVHDTLLTDWIEKSLALDMQAIAKAPVYLENNAALAGLGEAVYGAGEGHEVVVYHTISTGVGGAKIQAGAIDANRGSFEPGQQILDIDHTILGEDIAPTLENLVSASAVTARMGTDPFEIPQSDAIWDQLAYFLAHGLRNSILYWSPDVIVLGGPMMLGDPRISLDAVTAYTNEVVGEVTEVPLIVDGSFNDDAVYQGCLAYINANL